MKTRRLIRIFSGAMVLLVTCVPSWCSGGSSMVLPEPPAGPAESIQSITMVAQAQPLTDPGGQSVFLVAGTEGSVPDATPKAGVPQPEGVFEVNYLHGRLSVNAKNADVRRLLKAISEKTSVEVSIDTTIDGRVTVQLADVKLEDGVERILQLIGENNFAASFERQGGQEGQEFVVRRIIIVKKGRKESEQARILLEKKAAAFKEMGWSETRYVTEQVRTLAKQIDDISSPRIRGAWVYDELQAEWSKKHHLSDDWIRFIVETAFNPESSPETRTTALSFLWLTGDRSLIPVARKFTDDSESIVQMAAGDALYRLGDKATAFQLYEGLVKRGVAISNMYFDFRGDKEAKEMLLRTLDYDNPEMQALALNRLALLGERDSIMIRYLKLREDYRNRKIDYDKHPMVETYLRWTAEALEKSR